MQASTQAAMAYLGDPNAPDRPHYLETWANYLRGPDPAHKALITRSSSTTGACTADRTSPRADPAHARQRHGPGQLFLGNPFTAERDVNDIGTAILARA